MPHEPVLPFYIELSARPGETAHQDFVINAPLPNGALIATLTGNNSVIQLREFVAYDLVKHRLTDDEFNQLPPNLRNEANRWWIEFVQAASVGIDTPLPVRFGQHVVGVIECGAPATAPARRYMAALTINGLEVDHAGISVMFTVQDA